MPHPNAVLYCTEFTQTRPINTNGTENYFPPTTVGELIDSTEKEYSDKTGWHTKKKGEWVKCGWSQFKKELEILGRAFIRNGLEHLDCVSVLGFNSLEWVSSYLATIYCGGIGVGIYTTNGAEACRFILDQTNSKFIFVDSAKQAAKINSVKDQLPNLKYIIQWNGEVTIPGVLTYEQFRQFGVEEDAETNAELANRKAIQKPEDCCSMIYTSGTTNNPKGVMCSHDSILFPAYTCFEKKVEWEHGEGTRLVSFLPLSHIAAQSLDVFQPVMLGTNLYFAQPDAMKGSLVTTLKEVQPTRFFGVPRVYEKIAEKLAAQSQGQGWFKDSVMRWARGVGWNGQECKINGTSLPWGWWMADHLVFKKVRMGLGLGECKALYSAAAPLKAATQEFFSSLDLPINVVYGLSETCGPHTVSTVGVGNRRLHASGTHCIGLDSKIVNPDENGVGEIACGGRNIFLGYFKNEAETQRVFDSDGYFLTGDLGKIDEDGFLFITGRSKEIIITAGGENIAPCPIENAVLRHLPFASNVVLIGDQLKFLSILVTIKAKVSPQGNVLQDIDNDAKAYLHSLGSKAETLADCQTCEVVKAEIEKAVAQTNKNAVSRAANVQMFVVLDTDFSIGGGELTPTMKLKRFVVAKKYKAAYMALYE
eukprot:GCRY01004503.1.p1 GENE.GCRY01004503.1~~GCRY01004503.1.p1  ORF type:complete len:648 (+),score=176.50 GCRY01004503.1:210-2153(+)